MSDARTHVHWRSKELETQSESQSENGGSDDTSAESPERARSDTEPISPRSENLRHPQSVFRNKYEEILFDDGEEEYERAHCCNGLIPLEPLVATTHIFVAVSPQFCPLCTNAISIVPRRILTRVSSRQVVSVALGLPVSRFRADIQPLLVWTVCNTSLCLPRFYCQSSPF